MRRALTRLAAVFLLGGLAHAAARPRAEQLGRDVKLRILVDKVMQRHKGWVAEEWMIRESAEAGFNVYSPRQGGEDLGAVRQVTRWCKAHGLCHLPWMRGTLRAPASAPEDDRLVWADGTVSRLHSPNSDKLWDWMTRRIVAYAKIAAEAPTLLGVFLDYENYEATRKPNCYDLSYDLGILRRFSRDRGIKLPRLAPGERKAWLEKQKLHEAFEQFQVDHWRQRCRQLREAVDRHAPGFRFCVYPAPGTKLIVEAIYPQWGTKRAPLILADACTYGRPQFLPLDESLAHNRAKLAERRKVAKQADMPFLYAGGIDPAVRGADPEFSGKNAVMISEVTDGYWIFYEGPTYTKDDHRQYWTWFTWANRAIAAGKWTKQHEPRQTPRQWNFRLWYELAEFQGDSLRGPAAWRTPKAGGGTIDYAPVSLRGENLLLIACRRGQRVVVELCHVPVSRYSNLLGWELRDPLRKLLSVGTIDPKATGKVSFTPEADGVYLLAVSAGQCAYSLVRSNTVVGLYAGPGHPLSVIGGAKRLYFYVPARTKRFTVTAKGHGQETVRVDVFGPTSRKVTTGQTTPDRESVRVPVEVGEHGDAIWSLTLTRAEKGVLEDGSVALDGRLPPVMSMVPQGVFQWAGKAN